MDRDKLTTANIPKHRTLVILMEIVTWISGGKQLISLYSDSLFLDCLLSRQSTYLPSLQFQIRKLCRHGGNIVKLKNRLGDQYAEG